MKKINNYFDHTEAILYKRYVDDILFIFNCQSDAEKHSIYFLNKEHDVLINRGETGIKTLVYRKKDINKFIYSFL